MTLTSVDILDGSLRKRAPHRFLRALGPKLLTDGVVTAGVECSLEAVPLPAENVITVLRKTGPSCSGQYR